MKMYLLQLGSLTLFAVGLPLLYVYWCYRNYNKKVRTIRPMHKTKGYVEIT